MTNQPFAAIRVALLSFLVFFLIAYPFKSLLSFANSEGLPSSIVNGCVNSINGFFIENEVDLVLVGPEPIVLQRTWCQGESELNNTCGWSFGQPQLVKIKQPLEGPKCLELSCRDAGGGILTYTTGVVQSISDLKERKRIHFQLKRDNKLSNCGWGPLSARCNPKNSTVSFNRKERLCTLTSSDGVIRKFQTIGSQSKHDLKDSWGLLQSEQRPNGSLTLYEYGKKSKNEDDVAKITALHLGSGTPYGSITFAIHSPNRNRVDYTANTSDGRQITYIYSAYHPRDWRPNDSSTGQRQNPSQEMDEGVYNLTQVKTDQGPHTSYKYEQQENSFDYQITEKRKPQNRFLRIDYYNSGLNRLPSVGPIHLEEDSPCINRVKQLLAPVGTDATPLAIQRFIYFLNGKRGLHGGSTVVLDSHNHVTKYTYNGHGNLTDLERFHGVYNGILTPFSRECFVWGRANGPVPNVLQGKFLQDSAGLIQYCRFFNYDRAGNVTFDQLRGNLTGEGTYPQMCNQGYPLDNIGDCYTRAFVYTGAPYHLLAQETEDNGQAIDYQYVPGTNWLAGKLYRTSEGYYKREFFQYDAFGVLSQRIVDNGRGSTAEDLAGVTQRLVSSLHNSNCAPALGVTQVETDYYLDLESGNLKQLGLIHNANISAKGEVLSQKVYDADNTLRYTITRAFDTHGNKILESNPLGETNTWHYDANDNLIQEQGPDKSCLIAHTYDFANRKLSTTWSGSDGSRTNLMAYNTLSLCTSKRDCRNHLTQFHYDDVGHCTCEVGPLLQDHTGSWINPIINRDYDVFGNVTRYVDPLQAVTKRSYNSRGQLTEQHFPDGSSELKRYRPDGLLSYTVDRNQLTTYYQYDSQGRVISKSYSDSSGNCLGEETNTYDQSNLIATRDAEGAVAEYRYDSAGRLLAEIRGGLCKTHTYDSLNRLASVKEQYGLGVEDAILHLYFYDLLGRETETRVEDSSGNILRRNFYAYDALGNQVSIVQDLGYGQTATTKCRYNSFNELVESEDAEGHKTRYERRMERSDLHGQKILELIKTDPQGNRTVETYNCLNKPCEIAVFNPYGLLLSKRECHYDTVGNLRRTIDYVIVQTHHDTATALNDAQKIVNEWEYNSMQQVIKLVEAVGSPEQKTTLTTYNTLGQKSSLVKPNGTELFFTYDAKGRLTRQWSSDSTLDDSFTYDKCDRLLTIRDAIRGLTTQRSYDVWGNLQQETLANGLTLTYQHDAMGRPRVVQLPDGSRVLCHYSGMELTEISRLSPEGDVRYSHRYHEIDRAGRILKDGSSNGEETCYSYDRLNRLIDIKAPHWSQSIAEDGYDKIGNLTARQWKDPIGSVEATYTYDDLGQLKEERGSACHTYLYDSLNNRLNKDGKRYLYNSLHQLLSEGDTRYQYDQNGCRVIKTTKSTEVRYRYDALERLIGLITTQGEFRYIYDGLNRRISKEKIGTQGELLDVEHYLYHGEDEVGTTDRTQRLTSYRMLGRPHGTSIGRGVVFELEGRLYIPTYDHNGNVTSLLDGEEKQPVEVYRYSVFGEEEIYDNSGNKRRTSPVKNPWRFASKRVDKESGLVFFGRRAYDPKVGKWISPDPKGFDAGPNLYAYVRNAPLNRYDAYGLDYGESQEASSEDLGEYEDNFTLLAESNQQGHAYRDSDRWLERPFLEKILTAPGEILRFIGEHLVPIPGVREIFSISGCILSGRNPNHYVPHWSREHSCWKIYQIGHPDSHHPELCVFVNGICNSYHESLDSFKKTMANFDGFALHIYNASHGLTNDLVEVGLQKLGLPTNSVKLSIEGVNHYLSFLSEKGVKDQPIRFYGHSQGGLITYRTIQNLAPEARRRLDVHTFGSAKIIFASSLGLNSAINYVNCKDPIPALSDPLGLIRGSSLGIVKRVHSEEGIRSHAYMSKAYQTVREGSR